MKLLNKESNQEFDAEIKKIDFREIRLIHQSRRFRFDWREEAEYSVFRISAENENMALGLMSIIDISEEFRIHINLIETSIDNTGKDKKIDRIAGCFIAFAARIAFEKGYLGFVSLIPKTELITLYKKKYGFKQFGRQLALDRFEAIEIINKYI